MTRRRQALGAGVVLLWTAGALLAPAGAAAQSADPLDWSEDPIPEQEQGGGDGEAAGGEAGAAAGGAGARFWIDFGYHTQKEDGNRVHALSPLFGARVPVGGVLAFELRVPISLVRDDSGDADELVSTNPAFTGLWMHDLDALHLEAGLTFAMPVDGRSSEQRAAFAWAWATRGLWDPWQYAPDQLGLAIPIRAEYRHGALAVGANVEFGMTVPREGLDGMVEGNDGFGQFRYWARYDLDALRIGLRFQHVVGLNTGLDTDPTTGGGDKHQASILPFAEYRFWKGLFAGGGMLVNIDAPAGYLSSGARIWALRWWVGAEMQ